MIIIPFTQIQLLILEGHIYNIIISLVGGGLFLTNCFGKKTTGFNTGVKIDSNTFRNIEKGVLKDKGITTFWDREELNNMFRKIGYQIVNIENIFENRNSIFIEKHITYLMK